MDAQRTVARAPDQEVRFCGELVVCMRLQRSETELTGENEVQSLLEIWKC